MRALHIKRLSRSILSRNYFNLPVSNYCYKKVYEHSINNPAEFWSTQANELKWHQKWHTALKIDSNSPASIWFDGGTINMSENALDVNIKQGRGDQTAIYFESAYSNKKRAITYNELHDQVSRVADILKREGVYYTKENPNNTVLIYMANTIEAIIAMLACARVGATHSVVFGGFAAKELAVRIKHSQPKIIFASSCGIEPKRVINYKDILDEALKLAQAEKTKCIIFQRPELNATLNPNRDLNWEDEVKHAKSVEPIIVPSTHPLYILYTSGTTGNPKGVVRDTGGYATALKWSLPNVFGMEPGNVFWAASDVGWVVGHSYIAYGPLLHGCTSLIFEGKPVGTPDPGAFWRIIQDYKVSSLFCAPTAFRAIKKEDPTGNCTKDYDLSSLRSLFLAGERADPDTVKWAIDLLQVPVIDNYWQTEIGWPMVSNFMGLTHFPTKLGSATLPVPGFNISVKCEEGNSIGANQLGSIYVKQPLPPGCLVGLYKNQAGFEETYWSQSSEHYFTGDAGFQDEDGYVYIMTRYGDIINVSGHRFSTGSFEEILSAHPSVAECAVIGVHDPIKGQAPLGLIILKADVSPNDHEKIKAECIQNVLDAVGKVSAFRKVVIVEKLPKTRSGKILRAVLSKIVDKLPWALPPTVEDASVVSDIIRVFTQEKIIE